MIETIKSESGTNANPVGPIDYDGFWIDSPLHQTWLRAEAESQFTFFRKSLRPAGGYFALDAQGAPLSGAPQELFATTRLVHSYALGRMFGVQDCDTMIDHGMNFLRQHHHDSVYGGYVWSLNDEAIHDDRKLAYGHAFVLLAAASAKKVGHPDADALFEDIAQVLDKRFWEPDHGLFADEMNRDWVPFSTYRGFNANMHSAEALLIAYEATGEHLFLDRAGSILEFFVHTISAQYDDRIPEHYTADWTVDRTYAGDPMFRPAGTTPGHSFELARLLLQHWDLTGRKNERAAVAARKLVDRALADAWDTENGGFYYTLDFDGNPNMKSKFWWPVAEAIGVVSALIKLNRHPQDEEWYRRIWRFADEHFIDRDHGGWFPETEYCGTNSNRQFFGKPDLYHSIQAALLPLANGISRASLQS